MGVSSRVQRVSTRLDLKAAQRAEKEGRAPAATALVAEADRLVRRCAVVVLWRSAGVGERALKGRRLVADEEPLQIARLDGDRCLRVHRCRESGCLIWGGGEEHSVSLKGVIK